MLSMDNYVQIDIVLQYIILSLISVFHLKPDFTLWLIQKYVDLLVCQINISTANCERAAAVLFDWWIIVLKDVVQFIVSEKVKPWGPFHHPTQPHAKCFTMTRHFFSLCVIILTMMIQYHSMGYLFVVTIWNAKCAQVTDGIDFSIFFTDDCAGEIVIFLWQKMSLFWGNFNHQP